MRHAAIATVVTLVLVGFIFLFGSCYPMPPVNPPSCAQDPNQEWCAPPAFERRYGCSKLKVAIDVDAGAMDDAGMWHYPSHATMAPCQVDGGAR